MAGSGSKKDFDGDTLRGTTLAPAFRHSSLNSRYLRSTYLLTFSRDPLSSKIFFLGPGHTVPCLPTHLSMLYRRGNLDAIEEICNKILRFLSIQKNIILPPCIACNIVKNTTLSYVSRNLGDRGNALAWALW